MRKRCTPIDIGGIRGSGVLSTAHTIVRAEQGPDLTAFLPLPLLPLISFSPVLSSLLYHLLVVVSTPAWRRASRALEHAFPF